MRYAWLISLVGVAAAGFHLEPADTPQKLADLQTLPARQVLPQTRDDKTAYVYRDPSVCHCLYVGGESEYQQYQKLRLQKNVADKESRAALTWADGSWGGWGPGIWRQWP